MDVFLRDLLEIDLATIDAWASDGDLKRYLSCWTPRSFSERRWSRDLTWWQMIVAEGRDVGSVWLDRATVSDRTGHLGIYLGEPGDRGQGIGRRAIELAEENAAASWNLECVRLSVREDNKRAIACFERAGFIIVGAADKFVDGRSTRFFEMRQYPKKPSQASEATRTAGAAAAPSIVTARLVTYGDESRADGRIRSAAPARAAQP